VPGPKRRLGRGLEVLLPTLEPAAGDLVQELALDRIEPNPEQPRRRFDEASLRELADSLKEHGMLQPVIVRALGGRFQLVAGERRCRAAEIAGLDRVPAIVREYSDSEMLEIALLENLQREDLNPLEEAEAYATLVDRFGLTQEDLARRLGRSRPAISNALRLLTLEPPIRERAGRRRAGSRYGTWSAWRSAPGAARCARAPRPRPTPTSRRSCGWPWAAECASAGGVPAAASRSSSSGTRTWSACSSC
jgi:ParB family chromosome partitioning protein